MPGVMLLMRTMLIEILKKRRTEILVSVALIAFINFVAFFIVADHIGGDAVSGKIEAGHYYVASHGHYTEVSRALYIYSYIHTVSVFVTYPLFFICGYILDRKKRRDGSTGKPAA